MLSTSLTQQNLSNWLTFIHEFISKFINDIILLRTTKNPQFFSLPSSQLIKDKSITVIIYFVRRHIRFVVELWTINVTTFKNQKTKQLNLIKLNKKLITLNKTLISCLKMLPLYSVFSNKNFDFSFETEIEVDTQQEIESTNKYQISYNKYSDNIGGIQLDISYIDKGELFKMEDSLKQSIIQTQIDNTIKTVKSNTVNMNDTTGIIAANMVGNVKESSHLRISSQNFSFSNGSDLESDGNQFALIKKTTFADCPLTPYSKEGIELFWEKNEVKTVINRYNRLNHYGLNERQDLADDDCDDANFGMDDLFLGINPYNLNSSSSMDELELTYEDDAYDFMNESLKPTKNSKTVYIDEIAHKLALLKVQIQKRTININTPLLAKKLKS